ncbi:MAG: WecB/TagA/CpsF family glycosyltransferase [Proteobacteria bacterium]|nr:WecB/TagA/CpsF family glycosyltransferase [Pseudomonadota bacterium]
MANRISIGKLIFDALTLEEAAQKVIELSASKPMSMVVTPNADHLCFAEVDGAYSKLVHEAELVTADGMPIVWASRILRRPLPERVTGADLFPAVCKMAAKSGMSVFIMGGLPGEAELAASKISQLNPTLNICGTYCPPFGFEKSEAESQKAIDLVNSTGADILFLGVGSPKQEHWLATNKSKLNCGIGIGIGASIAFIAGTRRRAPLWMQRSGLEWLFRLSQEPLRLSKRYAKDLQVASIVMRELRATRLQSLTD